MAQRILIVDDDPKIVRLLRASLEQAGYRVIVAYDGETALHALRRERPDLVVLDLMLPDRDGWDVTRVMRADAALADTPIIMLTARVEHHDRIIGLEEGAGKIDLSKWPGARLATKEQALERERLAYENGLVPHMGKLRGDAKIYDVLDYENKFMSICHCCSCCCVVAVMKYGPAEYRKVVKRMEGVEVEINRDKCVGCAKCFKVCIYDALKMKENKAMIEQENCMGCGRCERACPNGAISISFDGHSRIDEFIARFESRVDIS